jgi:hypothetical protein
MPWYYAKETIRNIWNRTIQGYLVQGTFTENPKENIVHIPNPDPQLCQGVGRQKKKWIRNNMYEAEARAAVVMCYKCHNTSHTYKRCTTTIYACNAPATPEWAHQQLQDHPNPHPDVDVDVGVGQTQDLDDLSCL